VRHQAGVPLRDARRACRFLSVTFLAATSAVAQQREFIAAAAEPAELELSLDVSKSELLVAEPLLAIATLKGTRPVLGQGSQVVVLVDTGAGFGLFKPPSFGVTCGEGPTARVPPPEGQRIELFLSHNAVSGHWVFPSPGRHRLVAEYREPGLAPVRSSIVTVEVQAPTGDEAAAFSDIARLGRLALVVDWNTLPPTPPRPDLLAIARRHPASVYLQHVRLLALKDRIWGFSWRGQDPDGPDVAAGSDRRAIEAFARPRVVRLLPDLHELVGTAGQFEPEALDLLAGVQEDAGDVDGARATHQRIVRDYPNRYVTQHAREAVEEDDE
jgi:hypothetical protein